MPIKEYECANCKISAERLESSNASLEPPRCEKCGDFTVRVIGLSSFRLYGKGFYKPNER